MKSAAEHDSSSTTSTSARDLLTGRTLFVTGDRDALHHALLVDPNVEGLVLTSSNMYKDLPRVRRSAPGVITIVEPKYAMTEFATPERPFIVPSADDGLFRWSVAEALDHQRRAGADVAITPTGYIQAGEPDTVRAAVKAGNALRRDDMLLHVFLAPTYLRPDNLGQTTAILANASSPIALTVGSTRNPMDHRGVVDGVRHLVDKLEWVMPWRTDLEAFDAMAHGAPAASIGTIPSTRHGVPAGKRGQANNDDRSPAVLVPHLARYIRSGQLRRWFAATSGPTCNCLVCRGRPLDRFDDNDADRVTAMRHNLLTTRKVRDDLFGAPVMREAWYEFIDAALVAHAELRAAASVKVKTPPVLNKWSTRYIGSMAAASTVSSKSHEAGE